MKTFAALYRRLDAATSTKHKGQALQNYRGRAALWQRGLGRVFSGGRKAAPDDFDEVAAPIGA
jgi:hypothetical protein